MTSWNLLSCALVVFASSAVAQAALPAPEKLCSALASAELKTEGWKPSKAMPGEWVCMSQLVPFGTAGRNGLQNNIAYYVNGSSAVRITDVRLKININNPLERTQAQWRLESATAALFQAIDQQVPVELRRSFTTLAPTVVEAPFGRIELAAEPGRIESFKIIITPAATVRAAQESKASSVSDFQRCLAAVARAAGYAASDLAGDGSPTQEAGYKSFLIKGRGKDLFFCEVHPSDKFKIKAALGGQFPFRYITEERL